jgi:hypothetical protein
MLDGVCVVWAGILQEPFEVFRGQPRLTFVTTCGGRAVPHTRAARLPVVSIVVASHSRVPLKVLLAPLFVTPDTLLAAMGGDVGWCYLAAAQDCLPTPLDWTRHDRLIANGMLGGDVV